MLTAIKMGNLAVAFLLELCALAALGYWGFQVGGGTLAKVALGVGAPLLTAVVWGLFIAPKAVVTVPYAINLALRILVFGLAVAGLAVAGRPTWAWVLGVALAVNLALCGCWANDALASLSQSPDTPSCPATAAFRALPTLAPPPHTGIQYQRRTPPFRAGGFHSHRPLGAAAPAHRGGVPPVCPRATTYQTASDLSPPRA